MTSELFCVLDAVAKRFVDPFPAPTTEYAIRGFKDACGEQGHEFQKHPEDYGLYHIGTFDAELGVIVALDPRKIASAMSFVGSGPVGPEQEFEAMKQIKELA